MGQVMKDIHERWPVDLDECHAALQQLVERKHTLHVPPERTDADMVLSNALKQLERGAELLDAIRAIAQEPHDPGEYRNNEANRMGRIRALLGISEEETIPDGH